MWVKSLKRLNVQEAVPPTRSLAPMSARLAVSFAAAPPYPDASITSQPKEIPPETIHSRVKTVDAGAKEFVATSTCPGESDGIRRIAAR
jgi:hypothetical protein